MKQFLQDRNADLVINIPASFVKEEQTNGYIIRRLAIDFNTTLITNTKCAVLFVQALKRVLIFSLPPWKYNSN